MSLIAQDLLLAEFASLIAKRVRRRFFRRSALLEGCNRHAKCLFGIPFTWRLPSRSIVR
jgi:hypothetical protein